MLFSKSFLPRKLTLALLVMGLLAVVAWSGVATPPTAVASPNNLPSTITVNTATLSPTTQGDPNDGNCDLREALQAAFTASLTGQSTTFNECTSGAGPVFIIFEGTASAQPITMPAGGTILPFIRGNVTLTGPVTLAGSGVFDPPGDNHDSRLLRVASGGMLNLVALNIANGFTSGGGGAILGDNNSTINTAGVSFIGNAAYGDGGAIYSNGSVNILATNFSANQALGKHPANGQANPNTGHGGAIYISGSGSLNIALSNLSANTASKSGGGVYVGQSTTATISDNNFAANVAGGGGDNRAGGGALYNSAGTVSLIRSTFNANLSLRGYGGAIFNQLSSSGFTIEDSSFNANVVQKNDDNGGFGGAIYTEEDMSITRSTFNANVVQADSGRGGAIANNRAAILRVTNSTFMANVVTQFASVVPAGAGGAIANYDNPFPVSSESTVELRNVTLFLNKAGDDAGLYNANGESIKLWNTILDHGLNAAPLCSGTAPENMGNNIQSDGTSCGAGIPTADPKLNPPDFNGGAITSLLSLMPKTDSPAVDAGNESICTGNYVNGEDQRAKSRPKDGNGDGISSCDIGAIEADTAEVGFASNPVAPGPIDFGVATMAQPSSRSLSLIETGNLSLSVNGVLGGPNAAEFSIMGNNPATINDGDIPYVWTLTCQPNSETAGTRTATLTLTTNDLDNPTVVFDLTCQVPPAPVPSFYSDPAAPGPIEFGEVVSGSPVVKSLLLGNSGTATMAVSNLAISGPNAADFSVESLPDPLNISPNNSHSLQLTCDPTGLGLRLAQLTLTTNDATHPSEQYNLVCEGIVLPPPFLHVPGTVVPNDNPTQSNGTLWGIATSPDGRHLYVNDRDDDMLTVFEILPTGGIQRLAVYKNGVNGVMGLAGPRAIAISPNGLNVYVSAVDTDAVVVFSRDTQTGLLTYMHYVAEGYGYNCEFLGPCADTIDGLENPYELAVSPDNQYLYVTGEADDAIVVFELGSSGEIATIITGANIVEIINDPLLDGARGIALSPDGQHAYVASGVADSLVVFARNGQTGKLTAVQPLVDNIIFDGAGKVLVSHDGRHVYVASYASDTVTLLQRNAFSGQLTFLKIYEDGVNGFDGLNYPGGMALSPDGQYLYVPSYLDNVLNIYLRSAGTGLLYPTQTIAQPELDGAFGVALGPDGRTAYVAPFNTSDVVVLQPSNPLPIIETLLPASAVGGSNNFPLTIVGENFTPLSVVQWNGTPRETTFVSESELKITVQAADVPANPAVTQASVSVHNPAPGGGAASRAFFITQSTASNPVPAIAQLAPQSMPVGSDDFTLTIYGSGFIASSQVQWNGENVPTTYVNGTELTITVLNDQLLQAGTAVVTVQNPAPVGGASNNAPFDVVAVGQNPTPSLTEMTPKHTIARGPASKQVVVTVYGVNFLEDAQAQWNGFNRPTTVVSETELRVTLTAADVAEGGVYGIRVLNPEPGGGASNTLSFAVHAYVMYLPMMIR